MTVPVLANVAAHANCGELFRHPLSASLAGLSCAVFVKRLGDRSKFVFDFVDHPACQEDFVVRWATRLVDWSAKIDLHSPATDMEMDVALVFLPIEDISTGWADPA